MHNQNHPVFSTKRSPLGPGLEPPALLSVFVMPAGHRPEGLASHRGRTWPTCCTSCTRGLCVAAQEARPGGAAAAAAAAKPARKSVRTTSQSAGGGITCVAAARIAASARRSSGVSAVAWGAWVAQWWSRAGCTASTFRRGHCCRTTQVVHGFFVKHTEDLKESAAYPALVTWGHRDSTRAAPSPVAPPPIPDEP